MSRYVIIIEEVFLKHKELVNNEGKRAAKEMLYLYMLILFYCWGTPVCKKTIREICDIHDLEYHNSTRRAKILRTKGWIEPEGKYYRPLLIYSPKSKKSVKTTPIENSVKFTLVTNEKSVNFTPAECSDYTENDEKSVNFTPAYKEGISYLNTEDSEKKSETKIVSATTTAADETNGHKSQFSIEDCLRYIEIRIERGERIETPHKLARWCWQTGEYDLFIAAVLYPEPVETQTIEYDDEFASEAAPPALDESEFDEARQFLKGMVNIGKNLSEFESFYEPSDWRKLVEEIRK